MLRCVALSSVEPTEVAADDVALARPLGAFCRLAAIAALASLQCGACQPRWQRLLALAAPQVVPDTRAARHTRPAAA